MTVQNPLLRPNQSKAPLQLTRAEWMRKLRSHGIRPARSMGQNFLVEPEVVSQMVDAAGVGSGDQVVEIGPGFGILTRELLDRNARVLAVELDRELAALLQTDLGSCSNLTVTERDARYVDVGEWTSGAPWDVVANLPYSTGTSIVRRFLELQDAPRTMTVMVQREVAERMIARAPNVSLLSLAIQMFAEPELKFLVPPAVFEPQPKVDSAVVRMKLLPEPRAESAVRDAMFSCATLAFQRKRKTIANGLSQGFGLPRDEVEGWLARASIDPGLRPQAIDLDGWIRIAEERKR